MRLLYENIVPWGRSFSEYVQMFCLSDADLSKRILDCGGGPSSFTAEGRARGIDVISIDPLYSFGEDDISTRIDETFETVISKTREHKEKFIWKNISSIEDLGVKRMIAMKTFLEDYTQNSKNYINGYLPTLPFDNGEFDLALSSHFLFLYSDNLSFDFHFQSILEMLRVAKEVRIFPLLTTNGETSSHLEKLLSKLPNAYSASISMVDYEFQKGGNKVLVIGKQL